MLLTHSNQKYLNLQVKRNMNKELYLVSQGLLTLFMSIWGDMGNYLGLIFALVNMEIKLGAAPFNPDIDSCAVLKLIPHSHSKEIKDWKWQTVWMCIKLDKLWINELGKWLRKPLDEWSTPAVVWMALFLLAVILLQLFARCNINPNQIRITFICHM